jgi:S-DNA-T family DNA segregation ATPase FtsK/SpoIIIE
MILGGLAGFMALSIGIASVDPAGILGYAIAGPGRFFIAMLSFAAWWIPVYFLLLTVLVLRRQPITWASVILISLVHLPVLTIGAILQLLAPLGATGAALTPAPLAIALERSFTTRGAALILSLALAVEGVILLQIWRALEARTVGDPEGDDAQDRREERDGEPLETADETAVSPSLRVTPALPAPDVIYAAAPEPGDEDLREEDESGDRDRELPEMEDAYGAEPSDTIRHTLDRLRARMEEGLDDASDESESRAEVISPRRDSDPVEAPLPLIFGHRHASEDAGEPDEWDSEVLHEVVFEDEEHEIEVDDGIDGEAFDDDGVDDDEEDYEEAYEEAVDEDDLEVHLPPVVPPRRRSTRRKYAIPVDGILTTYSDGRYWEIDDTTRDASEVLRVTLEEFGIKAEVTGIRKGPVITMFEILPAPGVKLAKITNLADNIALRLAASSVRIVAPIPGKHAVGIEIPNRERNIVSFAELLNAEEFFESDSAIPIALGKDIAGEAQIVDLARMPHMLIAGATGSGKSVCVNSIICSILYRRNPNEVKLILIDPKIVELKFYNDIPHLLTPVITDPKRAFQALQYLIYEMERRYSLLDSLGARDISGFNARIKRKNLATEPLPYIVVIIDEFADLMATSGKELESTVARLAAMSRAVGIHLVLATQRPSTDVITGLIKANIPARIAFMVASKIDSRIIIDMQGAEKLLGRGDMLYTSSSDPFPVRMQGAFLTEDEVERVVDEVKTFGEPEYIDDEIFIDEDEDELGGDALEDPLMERAIEVVTSSRKASASYLQRRLKVGYNRAARMVEEMERLGIVGPQNGSKPRDVIGSGSGVA